MSAEPTHIRVLRMPDDPAWTQLPDLFRTMYAEMARHGVLLPLARDGEHIWVKGAMVGAEKFGRTVVLEDGEGIHGFAHGALKMAPEHLGGVLLGQVTHVHVGPLHRRSGHGERLFRVLEEWFQERKVSRIDCSHRALHPRGPSADINSSL